MAPLQGFLFFGAETQGVALGYLGVPPLGRRIPGRCPGLGCAAPSGQRRRYGRGHGRWGRPKPAASNAWLLDLKAFTGGLLAHGMGHAQGVMLFESTTPNGDFPEIRSGVIIYESMRILVPETS